MNSNIKEQSERNGGFRLKPGEPDVENAPEMEAMSPTEADKGHGQEIDDLGELPRSYGANLIFLVAQEPHWLFTYWDIDISRHPGGPTHLRVLLNDTTLESEIEVPFETRNWYIPVKAAGASYHVEIGYHRGDSWNVIAKSQPARTPADRMSESEAFQCATIPLHLSFESLMKNMQGAMAQGEALLGALARLQMEGKLFPGGGPLSEDRETILRALLGQGFLDELSSGGLSSAQIESRIREALSEKLSSGGASSFSLGEQFHGAESSLFSALGALASESMLSSFNVATLTSWATLAAWAAQARSSWAAENLSSRGGETSWAGAAQSSWAGEQLSSWTEERLSSWSREQLSSWTEEQWSSWSKAALSSWLAAAQSSWAQAALSSWNQQAFSSWAQAASSSWLGGSETLSSFGQAAREFYMHVNAEVIFYGGTDPRASVTVGGKPIQLSPDGTFRYHFIFPDGEFEIPIVATSPDGVETRRAVLRFERATMKEGGVADTAQPPLDAPMGRIPTP